MKTELENKKLPIWWIFLLVPLGILLTNLFFRFFSENIENIRGNIGISQPRIFSLLIYNLATGFAVLLYYFLLRRQGLSFKRAGYRNKLTGKGILFALAGFFVVSMILYPMVSSILGYFNIPMLWESIGTTPILQKTTQDLFLGILTAAILAPLTEDTIFRGYVYQMFSERTNPWIAIFISALLFAIIHISFFGPGLTIWVFFFGLYSSYLYFKFDNIYPSLLFHFINNIWAYVIVPMIFLD